MLALSMLLAMATPSLPEITAAKPPMGRPVTAFVRRTHKSISLHARKLRITDCQVGAPCDRSVRAIQQARYRLPFEDDVAPSSKDRAMAQRGTRCALIGQTICPSRTRSVLTVADGVMLPVGTPINRQ